MSQEQTVILTPTAPGELIDKITVLRIKLERITGESRLQNVRTELDLLEKVKENSFPKDTESITKLEALEAQLKVSNEEIWDMGDKIREFGDAKDFGLEFAEVALGIHLANDKRAALKKEINLLMNSPIIEEKSYKHWK